MHPVHGGFSSRGPARGLPKDSDVIAMSGSAPRLTVVVPVYNEAEAIGPLLEEAHAEFAGHGVEIVVVDDCSGDESAAAVQRVIDAGVPARLVRHAKRSGKSAALRTGALATRSLWMATMDGDGQDRPSDVMAMAAEVDLASVGEVGLVGGVRKQRTDGASRKYASRFANGLRRRVLRDDCPDTACGLKLLPRDVFLAMPFFDAIHRYMPAFVRHFGFEARYVPVDNRPREHGQSKYSNIGRAAAGVVDLMGVSWLLRRTAVPAREALLVPQPEAQAPEAPAHVR